MNRRNSETSPSASGGTDFHLFRKYKKSFNNTGSYKHMEQGSTDTDRVRTNVAYHYNRSFYYFRLQGIRNYFCSPILQGVYFDSKRHWCIQTDLRLCQLSGLESGEWFCNITNGNLHLNSGSRSVFFVPISFINWMRFGKWSVVLFFRRTRTVRDACVWAFGSSATETKCY